MKKATLRKEHQVRLAWIQRQIELNIEHQIEKLEALKETLFLPSRPQVPSWPGANGLGATAGEGSQMGSSEIQSVSGEKEASELIASNAGLLNLLVSFNSLMEGYYEAAPKTEMERLADSFTLKGWRDGVVEAFNEQNEQDPNKDRPLKETCKLLAKGGSEMGSCPCISPKDCVMDTSPDLMKMRSDATAEMRDQVLKVDLSQADKEFIRNLVTLLCINHFYEANKILSSLDMSREDVFLWSVVYAVSPWQEHFPGTYSNILTTLTLRKVLSNKAQS